MAIARRLGQDGAKVMVSSRKEGNVEKAVKDLQAENLDVDGMVCHVGKTEDRVALIEKVHVVLTIQSDPQESSLQINYI